jgi:hypothetical protein
MSQTEPTPAAERHFDTSSSNALADEYGIGVGGTRDLTDLPIVAAPAMSDENFAAELQRRHSPAAPDAGPLYTTCRDFGVNPAVALGFFAKESTFGTDPNGLAKQTLNWGNLATPTDPQRTTGQTVRFHFKVKGVDHFHDFPVYRSWVDGLADFCARLTDPNSIYVRENRRTVRTVLPRYAPKEDGNHPDEYADLVISLAGQWSDITAQQQPITAASPILGPASGTRDKVIAHIESRLPAGSEYAGSVAEIVGHYWTHAPGVRVDPFLAAAQLVLETDGLRAPWAARAAGRLLRRADAGSGLAFASWADTVQAHLGRLLAFALTDGALAPDQLAMIRHAPRYPPLAPPQRGTARTAGALTGRWDTGDPAYADNLIALAMAIRQ